MNKQTNEYYENKYMPAMNRIGKITGFAGVVLSFTPAVALAVIYGLLPQPAALLTAVIAGLAAFGVLWIVEPISYFPVLGPVGTYMAFLSGNISNMRVPCASTAQAAVGVQPGTPEGAVIATLGMAVSIIINVLLLFVGAVFGESALSMLPPGVVTALGFLLPALFGALLMQFALNSVKLSVVVLAFSVLFYLALNAGFFNWLPGARNYLPVLACVFFSVGVGMFMFEKTQKGSAKQA